MRDLDWMFKPIDLRHLWQPPLRSRTIVVTWALTVIVAAFSFHHGLTPLVAINCYLAGSLAVLHSWNNAMKSAPPIEVAPALDPELEILSSDEALKREIDALAPGQPILVPAPPPPESENAAIVRMLISGEIFVYQKSNSYGQNNRFSISDDRLTTAHISISDANVRNCYRRYLRALPIAEKIVEQQKLLTSTQQDT